MISHYIIIVDDINVIRQVKMYSVFLEVFSCIYQYICIIFDKNTWRLSLDGISTLHFFP